MTFEQWLAPIPLRKGVIGPGVVVWDRDRAWVVETADAVARTVDGGRTWVSSRLPGACLEWTGLAFATAEHGYLVCLIDGPTDLVIETRDGGETWSVANASAKTGSGWFGTRIAAAGEHDVWAAALDQDSGTQPFLAGSHDAGASWLEVMLPGLGPTYHGGGQVLPIGPPVIDGDRLAFATRGGRQGGSALRVWTSPNSGTTWSAVDPRDVGGDHLAFISPEHWVTWARETDELLVTLDAGRRWERLGSAGLPRGDVYGFAFSSPTDGLILLGRDEDLGGVSVVLFVTRDGGRSWRLAELEGP